MLTKLVFLVGAAGAVGAAYYTTKGEDPTVVPYSAQQVRGLLTSARTTLPRRDGPGQIEIWSTGRTEKGVGLAMRYATWAPVLTCEAVVTAVAPDRSRVVPSCGQGPKSDSAVVRVTEELRVPMFEEHVQATLAKRPFDRKIVDRRTQSVVLGNIGELQREAMRSADEAAKVELGMRQR